MMMMDVVAKDANEANHLMSGLDFKAAVDEVRQWVEYLVKERGASAVGVTGFCMGTPNPIFMISLKNMLLTIFSINLVIS